MKWSRWSDIVVTDLLELGSEENLLVLTDTYAYDDIAVCCLQSGLRVTPHASLLVFDTIQPKDPRDLPSTVKQAMCGADAVISLCETRIMATPACQEALQTGTRVLATEPRGTHEFLYDSLLAIDYKEMIAQGHKLGKLWSSGNKVKVTSAVGTDLEFEMGDRPVLVSEGKCTKKGSIDFFPGILVSVAPVEETINGVLAVDGSVYPSGTPATPIMVELKQGRIERIYGDGDAAVWGEWFDSLGDETARHLCHFSIGINPAAKLKGDMIEDERYIGAVTCGFGNQDPAFKGNVGHGRYHVDVVLKSPIISVDGRTFVSENSLQLD